MADEVLQEWVVWTLDSQRCALPVSAVERVLPALEVTPLANAPERVEGVVILQGREVVVLNLRRCLGLPARDMQLGDSLVLARGAGGWLAFFADQVQGVVRLADVQAYGALQIRDLSSLLSADDHRCLTEALAARPIAHAA